MSGSWRVAVAGLTLAVTGCGGKSESVERPPQRVAEVRTVRVAAQPYEVAITAVGTVEPEKRVVVAAQEEGLVTALNVREGDVVRTGQVVAVLDDRQLESQLAEAAARLVEAESAWGRAGNLVREGLITAADADAAKATFAVNQARVQALRTRLSFTRITAPVDGIVTVRHVELGDVVGARAPVVELASGRTVLRVPVSELEVVKLAPGDRVTVVADALPSREIGAHINRIFPAADAASRQVTVELVLDAPPAELRPGFLARARLVTDRLPAAILVPEQAVVRGSEHPTFVWLVQDGVARVRGIEVGRREGGQAIVASGLAPGDLVVVEGGALLKDGAPVTVAGERS